MDDLLSLAPAERSEVGERAGERGLRADRNYRNVTISAASVTVSKVFANGK